MSIEHVSVGEGKERRWLLRLRVCTYGHTYTHTHTHTHTVHTYIHTYVHVHTYIHTYIYTHTCMHTMFASMWTGSSDGLQVSYMYIKVSLDWSTRDFTTS